MEQREYGVDLLKIMACVGVVSLHTINGSLGIINRVVTLICSLSIPIFFMCSGYVMFLKKSISYRYVVKKVIKILVICYLWEMIHAILYFLYYHQIRNFVKSFFLDFLQKGLFFHFWFLGSLIILYVILPILREIEKRTPRLYLGLIIFLGAICVCIDGISVFIGEQLNLLIIQTFRLWIWLFYYMLGGFIAAHNENINIWTSKRKNFCVVIVLFLAIAWQWVIGMSCFQGILVEGFYGSLPVIMATICTFLFVYKANLNNALISLLKRGISCIMGVYIVHPFVLAVIIHFIPIFGTNGFFNLIFWMTTVFLSGVIAWVIGKIPVICELIRI